MLACRFRFLTLLLALLNATSLFAQAPTPESVVALRQKIHEAQARVDVCKWEIAMLGKLSTPGEEEITKAHRGEAKEALGIVEAALRKTHQDVNANLVDPNTLGNAEAIRKRWLEIANRRASFYLRMPEHEATFGLNWAMQSAGGFRLTIWDGVLLVWVGFAFLFSKHYASRVLRLKTRRERRAKIGVALLLLSTLQFSGCASGPSPLSSEADSATLNERLTKVTADADAAEANADARLREYIQQWTALLKPDDTAGRGNKSLEDAEFNLAKRLRGGHIQTQLTQRLADESANDRDELDKDTKKLNDLVSSSRWRAFGFLALRLFLLLGLTYVALLPLIQARKYLSLQAKHESETCPRCATTGKLSARRPNAPANKLVECRVCGNQFPESYRDEPRLCFPTIGIRASGKTHMLATAYHMVKSGDTKTNAALMPMPSRADERFNAYITAILRMRGTAGASVHGRGDDLKELPEPILLHLKDLDPKERNGVMVNLFDYAGEVMEKSIDTDLLRRRACQTDGFLLFLDPTQLYGDNGGVYLEDQMTEFTRFYQDCVEVRKLRPGQTVPVPVAVCVTKFDLLPTKNPIGGPAIAYIRKLMTEMNPTGLVTLKLLKQRSGLVEELLPAMLPGSGQGMPTRLREQFGERVMYFPMTSVNLNIAELGNPEAGNRTPSPFGVLEPILWLLHMHGYCVFSDAMD